jgi:type I restriction enzyme S subunit
MKPGWRKVRLGDVCSITHGFAFKGQYFCDAPSDYLLVTPGNFAIGGGFQTGKPKYYNGPIPENYILAKGNLIVTMTDLSKQGDTLGYSALVPKNNRYLHNQRIGLLTITSQNALKGYIYWLMRTKDYQKYVVNHASGSTVKHTSPKSILSYEFDLPPLPTQRAIAATLSCLDYKIELNNRINANLEAQAQVIFKSWFVDFEPWGGVMPDGWRVGSFTSIVNILGGGTPKTNNSKYWGGNIPFFTPKDISGLFVIITEKFITHEGLEKCNSKLYPENTIFITARGTVGKIVFAGCNMAISQTSYALLGKEGYSQYFVYGLVQEIVKRLKHKAMGAVFDAIVTRDFDSELVIIPPRKAIDEYSSVAQPLYSQILTLSRQSRALAAIRDALLPKLMSGEIEVSE